MVETLHVGRSCASQDIERPEAWCVAMIFICEAETLRITQAEREGFASC